MAAFRPEQLQTAQAGYDRDKMQTHNGNQDLFKE